MRKHIETKQKDKAILSTFKTHRAQRKNIIRKHIETEQKDKAALSTFLTHRSTQDYLMNHIET